MKPKDMIGVGIERALTSPAQVRSPVVLIAPALARDGNNVPATVW
jgi:hypothetical protein